MGCIFKKNVHAAVGHTCGIMICLVAPGRKVKFITQRLRKVLLNHYTFLNPRVSSETSLNVLPLPKNATKIPQSEQSGKWNHITPTLKVKVSMSYLYPRQLVALFLNIPSYRHFNFLPKGP